MLTSSSTKKSCAKASLGVVIVLTTAMVGCGTFKLPAALDGFTPVGKSEVESEPAANSRGTFEVLKRSSSGKGGKSTQQLTGTVLLQDVLEASGAVKKFRSMEITIYRPVKGSPVPLQMQCNYDSGEDSVAESENYEIFPGDKILMEEVSGSKVGKYLDGSGTRDR